jgi:hypothetical protein
VKESFEYVNEELRIKQEEANRKALEKQRTQVFNMVKNDTEFLKDLRDTMFGRIDWINNHIS